MQNRSDVIPTCTSHGLPVEPEPRLSQPALPRIRQLTGFLTFVSFSTLGAIFPLLNPSVLLLGVSVF